MTGEKSRLVRHFTAPRTIGGWLRYLRFTIARRVLQLALLGLFIGTARCGWTLFGEPLLSGDFTSSLIAGVIPLSDPFAALQKLAAGHRPELVLLAGSALVLLFYILAGGRSFCAWVCPMNIVTDAAAWARGRLGIRTGLVQVDRRARYFIALGCLAASALTGAAAFEWVSPQAFLWREAVWGLGMGFVSAVLGVFALDLLLVKRGWCGHLCPLGAFWACVGRAGVVKPLFQADRCTRCGDCLKVCPEPQVISFRDMDRTGFIRAGACTNCGRCVAVCPEEALRFGLRFSAQPSTVKRADEPPVGRVS